MILDIRECQPGSTLQGDVCIIGSGAAGITLAREFLGTPHSILVLEGGGGIFEEPGQDPYRSSVTGLPHGGIHAVPRAKGHIEMAKPVCSVDPIKAEAI